ncbi:hypothetical protein I4U23_021283 [Adineta vaga]|nr:hypothetical protein I4U23_021283 [Adineta vaga]
MTSRLDRLLTLLSNGDSPAVKRSAATQIGQIASTLPKEVEPILNKLKRHVIHPSWDVRIACGLAIELISKNISDDFSILFNQNSRYGLKLNTFNFNNVIANSSTLYLGARKIEEIGDYDGNVSVQKKFVRKEFNFGLQEGLTGTDLPVEENDFKMEAINSNNSNVKCISSSDLQRFLFGEQYAIIEQDLSIEPTPSKRLKSSSTNEEIDENRSFWSLNAFYDWLIEQIFQPVWEHRHGSVTAIRDFLKGQQITSISNDFSIQWLEDLSVRLLTLIILDRFADYVSDEVVAPIRETGAQALSIICNRLHDQPQCSTLILILLNLLKFDGTWEIRHGALITLKYTFNVLKEIPENIRIQCVQGVRKCLEDESDDVVAAAAATLLPLVTQYESVVLDCASGLIGELIALLDSMDDLNSAASSIMNLLAKLLASNSAEKFKLSFAQVLPKIFPFCRHHTLPFRLAAIQTVMKIIEASQSKLNACTPEELAVLEHTFRLLFERAILESDEKVLSSIEQAWNILCQSNTIVQQCTSSSYQRWICLSVHPAKVPINSTWLLNSDQCQQSTTIHDKDDRHYLNSSTTNNQQYLAMGFTTCHQEAPLEHDRAVSRCRRLTARLFGQLFVHYDQQQSHNVLNYLTQHLNYRSAVQRMLVGMIASEWAKNLTDFSLNISALQERLIHSLNDTIYFDEIAPSFTKLKRDFTSFMHECAKQNLCSQQSIASIELHSVDHVIELCDNVHSNIDSHPQLNGQKQNIRDEAQRIQIELETLSLRSTAYLASACVYWRFLGDQLNPLIRPMMDALKKESDPLIQDDIARAMAELIWQCTQRTTTPNPNNKIVKNLCNYVCADSDETPHVMSSTRFTESSETTSIVNEEYNCTALKGIYTWQKTNSDDTSKNTLTRDSSTDSTPTPSSTNSNAKKFNFQTPNNNDHSRHGGESALSAICHRFGPELQTKLSDLYNRIVLDLEQFTDELCQTQSNNDAQQLADTLQILTILIPNLHDTILNNYLKLLPNLSRCLLSKYTVVRFFTARCLGVFSLYKTEHVFQYIIDSILPKLTNTNMDTNYLQGPIEALYHIIDKQALNIVPYARYLMVPCIQSMTHQDWYIRSTASNCFAVLIKYYALHNDDKTDERKNGKENGDFLEQLFDNTKMPVYHLPMQVKVDIRPYQHDGINWLMFLKRYNLSCVLADDMGLGKTLQTICVLASDIVERRKENLEIRPSLVVSPPTLTRHWTSEMNKFVSEDILRPLLYSGKNLAERDALRNKYLQNPKEYTVIVASYDVVRSDIAFFSTIAFNYCVLDEGHVIRNSKTKLSKAIRQISAAHRLILSGTPIQNNALELWKLFDFLMPGYLGSEKQFIRRYQKPLIASSRDRDLEHGQLAMDVLHKQVKPFMLRRLKTDVLDDLPPKILQDYYCELSSIQCMLYEDFANQTKEQVKYVGDEPQNQNGSSSTGHVFKALQYLRKLCNHPSLILTPEHPKWSNVQNELKDSRISLNDIRLSGKLLALKELLIECGIGVSKDAVVSTHRALIFCQMKVMIDVIINQVLGTMENVSFLRLDSSLNAVDRFNTVNLFNSDPSIDLLLLTTHIGGLGLNLTGADTVIFVEHDWNPSKDLQAMDRAHRIGQKKVVNVYRLITRNTIEEKIMNLQRFKTNLADTVLASDNNSSSLLNLDRETNLIDLISLGDETKGQSLLVDNSSKKSNNNNKKQTLKAILDTFSEQADNDEECYSEEYDVNKFVQQL